MGLTDREIEEIKKEHCRYLEEREARRREERAKKAASVADDENSDLRDQASHEHEVRDLKRQIEGEFYTNRGYTKYKNHRSEILWLTPEECARRVERKRRMKRKRRSHSFIRHADVRQLLIYLLITIIALVAGMYIAR